MIDSHMKKHKDFLNLILERKEQENSQLIEASGNKIDTEKDFKEYATTVLKKAHGDDFDEKKANEMIDGIIGKVDGDWEKAIGMVQSSLG